MGTQNLFSVIESSHELSLSLLFSLSPEFTYIMYVNIWQNESKNQVNGKK